MSLVAPLIFVGLPGAGKSTVGRAVAEKLGCGFVDFDRELAQRTGLTVPQIFAQQGVGAFRKMERELTEELLAGPATVWAPGGGWATIPGVLALVRPHACIIHLSVSPDGALARVRQDASIRPLLAGADPHAVLERLLAERASCYAEADYTVATDGVSIEQVVQRVLALVLDHYTRKTEHA